MKQYEVKIYELDWTFKETLLWTEIINDFSFSAQINWWQWEWIFELDKTFGNISYLIWDFVKVYVYTDDYTSWLLLYTWIINKITRKITGWIQTLQLSCLWLASILSFIYFYSWSYAFNKNQDPAQTIKDVIDYFNTKYTAGWIGYSWWNISNYWSSINIDFNYTKCFDAIKNLKNATNYRWFLGANWDMFFKQVPSSPTHTFTLEKDLDEIILEENWEKIINKHILNWKSWTATNSDPTSQTTYWLRELFENKTDIADLSSANIYWTNYIANNKDYKKKTSVIINNSYNIESIKPWDTIKILNIDYTIDNLQINKISYSSDKIRLELDQIDSVWNEIFNI